MKNEQRMRTHKEKNNRLFQRNEEDFVCANCDAAVFGDGYRNHCPCCLYSKHVDVNPGDRAEECGGMMKVVDIVLENGELVFTHECIECKKTKRNKAHSEDDIDTIVKMMSILHR